MKNIQFLTVRWLLVSCLVLVGIFAAAQAVEAGTPGNEPEFTISGLVISPAEANTGQTITISATINETANISGIYEGTLKINDVVEETKSVTVGPNASKQITFTILKNVAGTYSVDLDGLEGSFTVIGEPIAESDSSFPTVPVVIGIVAAVVIVGLLIFYLNKRKAA
jgi:hypothetical protein